MAVQTLESRAYLAAAVIDPIADQMVPAGKTIQVPLTATADNGATLNYTVTSDDPSVTISLHPTTNTWLRLNTTQGPMTFQLFNDIAPHTVATMAGLVNAGFFNGLKFYSIAKSGGKLTYIASGSPTGTASGGPGFRFDDEFNPDAIFSNSGVLAMLNAGRDNNGSQFLITAVPARSLDFTNTIWGQLVRGFSTLNRFLNVPVTSTNDPLFVQKIKSAAIITDTTDAVLLVKGASDGSAKITVQADDGAGGVAAQSFEATIQPDTANGVPINDRPILGPVSDMYTPKNRPISFRLSSIDLEGDPVQYAANFGPPSTDDDGSLIVNGDVVTFTPRKNLTGPVTLFVGAGAADGSVHGNPYDTQQIQIAVGDQPATAAAPVTINALPGISTGRIAVANFTDSDPAGTAANWSAVASVDTLHVKTGGINWGDDAITDGVISHASGSTFSVIGSHVYPAVGTYPLTVVAQGDLGARVTLRGTTVVHSFASISANALTVNGTSGDDVIGISEKSGMLVVNIGGVVNRYPADGITRVNVLAYDGNDRVTIGAGVPGTYVDAGAGNDFIDGGDGNDTLTGGAGRNTLNGNGGDDRLNGSGGRDMITGGEGNDYIYGNGGDDTMDGGSGVDHLFAGDGNDLVIGGGGNDKMYGEAGNDTLIGGKGADGESGGPGIDTAQQDGTDILTAIEVFT